MLITNNQNYLVALIKFEFLLFILVGIIECKNETTFQTASIDGDIILGGLFPVHGEEGTKFCKKVNLDRGIQRLEAMLFTIQEINERADLLKDITIGARVLDTCSKDTYAIEQSLDFIKSSMADNNDADDYYCADKSEVLKKTKATQKIRTVIGGSYSSVSILVANLLKLFKIPQISYASTSAVLTDKRNYPLFARTLPSDQQQAKAMAALVAWFNWTYVSTVRSSGDYGDSGIDAFWKESIKLGVCIAAKEMIKPTPSDADLLSIVKTLKHEFSRTRVVVLFTRLDHTRRLLNAVKQMNLSNYFMWIASDGWGREFSPVINNSDVANGAFTFEVKTVEIHNFTTYFKALRYNNPHNPWFKEYWEEVFDCYSDTRMLRVRRHLANVNSTSHEFGVYFEQHVRRRRRQRGLPAGRNKSKVKRPCSEYRMVEKRKGWFKQESKIQSVYDAVYAVAYALNRFMNKLCQPYNKNMCIKKLNDIEAMEFYQDIINHSFVG